MVSFGMAVMSPVVHSQVVDVWVINLNIHLIRTILMFIHGEEKRNPFLLINVSISKSCLLW